jgi:hypothetical protein
MLAIGTRRKTSSILRLPGRAVMCVHCGATLPLCSRRSRRYCTPVCRVQAWRQQHPVPRDRHRVCARCGRLFESERSTRRYCCAACIQHAWRVRHAPL